MKSQTNQRGEGTNERHIHKTEVGVGGLLGGLMLYKFLSAKSKIWGQLESVSTEYPL